MLEGVDWTRVVACAPRPETSMIHFLVLIGFVLAARWLAPRAPDRHAG